LSRYSQKYEMMKSTVTSDNSIYRGIGWYLGDVGSF